MKPAANVAERELKRQFNTKANQVRNLIDNAESLGNAADKYNLIKAAASLPSDRNNALNNKVISFCHQVLYKHTIDSELLNEVLVQATLTAVEFRVLLGSIMFLIEEELDHNGKPMLVRDLLTKVLDRIAFTKTLSPNDPFVIEARCILEAMKED
jgi:hypothetical protein